MNKKSLALVFLTAVLSSCIRTVTLDDAVLMDKIRGGWYAQTIGCTYGGPTEFRFKGRTIPDSISLQWYDKYIYDMFVHRPGLYDDVYMDLTFLEVMAEHGTDAGRELYAEKFANAPYFLWHANQAARYNILHGCAAPESGFWKNNPHADDIDFQIESDFIGMLTPGRPDIATGFCDTIGHIMNYGDGWYGGVFTAAMYSYAYVYDDVEEIVGKAVRMIPEGTGFRNCIEDVLQFHRGHPWDWKECWDMVQEKYSNDIGCPDGVWDDFDIDATINAAYVVIGLLYGKGKFRDTMEISTRCGQDSDCNPATAAGILGVIYGYEAIPEEFRKGAELISDIPFPYTSLSLNDVCEKNLELLKEVLGTESRTRRGKVRIKITDPSPVRYEQSFEGIRLKEQKVVDAVLKDDISLEFVGSAFVIKGKVSNTGKKDDDYTARIEVSLDGSIVEVVEMPADYRLRKPDVFYRYGLDNGKHKVSLRLLNPDSAYCVNVQKVIVYDSSDRNEDAGEITVVCPEARQYIPDYPSFSDREAFYNDSLLYRRGYSLRNTERGKRAIADACTDLEFYLQRFGAAMGVELGVECTATIAKYIRTTYEFARSGISTAKKSFSRQRPFSYFQETSAVPEEEEEVGEFTSYPSGHAIRAWAIALALVAIDDAHYNEIIRTALEICEGRIIVGFHYASDVECSKMCASIAFAKLVSDPEYAKLMAGARRELDAVKAGEFERKNQSVYGYPQAEYHKAGAILMYTPGAELFDGVIHPDAGLYDRYFDIDKASDEHRNYISMLEAQGCTVHTVSNTLLSMPHNKLVALADASLSYDVKSLPRAQRASQTAYKQQVLASMSNSDLVRIILNRPTVILEKSGINTGFEARYVHNPLMNMYFLRDQSITTPKGHILCRMNSSQRGPEVDIIGACYEQLGEPAVYRIKGRDSYLEGGDYIPFGTISLIGQGLRTNRNAINELLENDCFAHDTVVVVKERWKDQYQMHLDTYFNVIDKDLCTMCFNRYDAKDPDDINYLTMDMYVRTAGEKTYRLDPVYSGKGFREFLQDRGVTIIRISKEDADHYANNFLAIDARHIMSVAGQSKALEAEYEKNGVKVVWVPLENLIGGYGAAHCMTQVLSRKR